MGRRRSQSAPPDADERPRRRRAPRCHGPADRRLIPPIRSAHPTHGIGRSHQRDAGTPLMGNVEPTSTRRSSIVGSTTSRRWVPHAPLVGNVLHPRHEAVCSHGFSIPPSRVRSAPPMGDSAEHIGETGVPPAADRDPPNGKTTAPIVPNHLARRATPSRTMAIAEHPDTLCAFPR